MMVTVKLSERERELEVTSGNGDSSYPSLLTDLQIDFTSHSSFSTLGCHISTIEHRKPNS